jgi:negative regulator of flagellin synthesis FlgM
VNQNIQSTQTEQTKKSDSAAKTAKAGQLAQIQKNQGSSAADSKADISAKGKEFAQVHAAAKAAPDVREDRIAALKKQIQEGKYEVDSKKIADKMVGDHLAF